MRGFGWIAERLRRSTAREEAAPGPAPGAVRLRDDARLSDLLAYGTAVIVESHS